MDLAYDHIQEQALTQEGNEPRTKGQGEGDADTTTATPPPRQQESTTTLNSDFQEAYKVISSSPWGARLGGLWGSVVKQGESVYKEAQQELVAVQEEATKGFGELKATLASRTAGLAVASAPSASQSEGTTKDGITTDDSTTSNTDESASTEAESVLSRLKLSASKRLREIEKAEDAADEALLRFGTSISNFLKDAVSIAPSTEQDGGASGNNTGVLFESKDATGKRVIHTTRFDAQLHAIHSSLENFSRDPVDHDNAEAEAWTANFSVEAKTADITRDLETYPELRKSMESLVPEKVTYEEFWKRYYFLRRGIEEAERRRRELLKGAVATEEEDVAWDEDSDEETPTTNSSTKRTDVVDAQTPPPRPASAESSTTIHPAIPNPPQQDDPAIVPPPIHTPIPKESRTSDEKSRPDSDASYDVVGAASGVTSQAPNSPKDMKDMKDMKDSKDPKDSKEGKKEESDEEEDWE